MLQGEYEVSPGNERARSMGHPKLFFHITSPPPHSLHNSLKSNISLSIYFVNHTCIGIQYSAVCFVIELSVMMQLWLTQVYFWKVPSGQKRTDAMFKSTTETAVTLQLEAYTSYRFQVVSFNSVGDGPGSNVVGPLTTPETSKKQELLNNTCWDLLKNMKQNRAMQNHWAELTCIGCLRGWVGGHAHRLSVLAGANSFTMRCKDKVFKFWWTRTSNITCAFTWVCVELTHEWGTFGAFCWPGIDSAANSGKLIIWIFNIVGDLIFGYSFHSQVQKVHSPDLSKRNV